MWHNADIHASVTLPQYDRLMLCSWPHPATNADTPMTARKPNLSRHLYGWQKRKSSNLTCVLVTRRTLEYVGLGLGLGWCFYTQWLITNNSSSLINHHSSLINHYITFITHYLSLITYHSSLITHHSSLITHHSSLISQHSSLITHHSSLVTHHLTLITHHLSLITHHSSLITHHSSFNTHHSSLISNHSSSLITRHHLPLIMTD